MTNCCWEFFSEMMHIWWSSIKCVTISSLMPSAHLFSSETCLSLWGRNDPISKNTTSTFFRWNTLSFKRNKSVSQNLKTMMDPISRIAFLGKDLSTLFERKYIWLGKKRICCLTAGNIWNILSTQGSCHKYLWSMKTVFKFASYIFLKHETRALDTILLLLIKSLLLIIFCLQRNLDLNLFLSCKNYLLR